jgi:hypothetical protein
VAGFRNNRGRQQRQPYPQQPPQQQYGRPPAPGYGQQQQWQQGGGGQGGPEYYRGQDPYYPDNPGHTHPYGVGEAPDGYGPGPGQGPGPGPGPDQYGEGGVYRAGQPAPPIGPRLHWKPLLSGIVLHPNRTFWQMRDHTMWAPALIVTFLYGLLAVFGLEQAREEVINSTITSSIPWMIATGIAVIIFGLIMGAVTHTLARNLGGTGSWAPTVGLSMLITSITDTPRLLIAMFTGAEATVAQVVGWATWIAAAALLTSMVSKSHDLPWPRALAAAAIQLVALLVLIKLGTL